MSEYESILAWLREKASKGDLPGFHERLNEAADAIERLQEKCQVLEECIAGYVDQSKG